MNVVSNVCHIWQKTNNVTIFGFLHSEFAPQSVKVPERPLLQKYLNIDLTKFCDIFQPRGDMPTLKLQTEMESQTAATCKNAGKMHL